MYLAYLDDSDTKQKASKWQVMSAVIVKDCEFAELEITMGVLAQILLAGKIDLFTEFHACELFGGHGVFEGIDQAKRFHIIGALLDCLKESKSPVVYGAVDLVRLNKMVYGSADPLDIAFRICAKGVDDWIGKTVDERFKHYKEHKEDFGENPASHLLSENMAILIADDCDSKTKASIQGSFRKMRTHHRRTGEKSKLRRLHDDMYFGDSKYSIGIQMADLCSYFIARHLDGDAASEGFYKLIEPHIVHSQIMPEE